MLSFMAITIPAKFTGGAVAYTASILFAEASASSSKTSLKTFKWRLLLSAEGNLLPGLQP
jgi:hypothetical protein